MRKVFLYLYPIEEYAKMFLLHDESKIEKPLPVLNETINKRYREKGYQVVYALYPDKELYGIDLDMTDMIIYTDVKFSEASAYDEKGNEKKDFIPKYPSEKYIIDQLGEIDELIVGGYHFSDCVKRVAEYALERGINTLIDIDMTDLFFNLYKQKEYFDKENYSPERYKKYMINRRGSDYTEFAEKIFNRNYASPVYGFNNDYNKKVK